MYSKPKGARIVVADEPLFLESLFTRRYIGSTAQNQVVTPISWDQCGKKPHFFVKERLFGNNTSVANVLLAKSDKVRDSSTAIKTRNLDICQSRANQKFSKNPTSPNLDLHLRTPHLEVVAARFWRQSLVLRLDVGQKAG